MKLAQVLTLSIALGIALGLECDAGYKVVEDSCAPCSAGQFDSGNNTCSPCPGGSVSEIEGALVCEVCPVRMHSSDNATVCLPCTNGHYADTTGNVECKPCAEGYFTDKTGSIACDPCPIGSYQDKAGFDFCYPCAPGTFANTPGTPKCTLCPVNTYLDTENQSECTPCPAGTYQDEEGQEQCKPCAIGYYGDVAGEGCKACASGSFTNTTGAVTCQGCAKGYYNRAEGQTECLPCPKGQFQNLVGQDRCEPCPPRTYGDKEGEDYCHFCPAGTFSAGSGNTHCAACPAGSFNEIEAQEECRVCPPGFYQDEEGRTLCKPCKAGTSAPNEGMKVCDVCQPGSYSAKDKAIRCDLCARGYFQPEESSTHCKSCIWGKTTADLGAKQPSQCYWEQCPPGFQYVGGETMCVQCEAGSYSEHINSPQCIPCALGHYTEFQRASFCDACPDTHFTYTVGSDSKSDCKGPVLAGYTMKNFGGRKIEIYDSSDSFEETIWSVRVFQGEWEVFSGENGQGYSTFLTEGGEYSDLQMALNYNGAKSARTTVNDLFCFTEKGAKYSGTRDYTVSGKSCQYWNSTHPHQHDDNLGEEDNHCRNPDGKMERPWCYTNDPETRWEYCDVPSCVWDRDCQVGDGTHYRGTVSTTRYGRNCQNWDSDFPHPHGWHSATYANRGIGNNNYCRNPSGERTAWCYTTNLFHRWEICGIPTCNKDTYSYYDQRLN